MESQRAEPYRNQVDRPTKTKAFVHFSFGLFESQRAGLEGSPETPRIAEGEILEKALEIRNLLQKLSPSPRRTAKMQETPGFCRGFLFCFGPTKRPDPRFFLFSLGSLK